MTSELPPTAWHIVPILGRSGIDTFQPPPTALIILNQAIGNLKAFESAWAYCCRRYAADGGANRLRDAICDEASIITNDAVRERPLDVIIGDLDSVDVDTLSYFQNLVDGSVTPIVIKDGDQYSTDFDKAVKDIRRRFPDTRDIVAIGGLGGRVDQGLSQLHHLYKYQKQPDYRDGRMFLLSDESLTFLLKPGKHRICVRESDVADVFDKYVGIVPVGRPSIITTQGLEWDVNKWETEFGDQISTSNHVLPTTEMVDIETTADVVFTIALKK